MAAHCEPLKNTRGLDISENFVNEENTFVKLFHCAYDPSVRIEIEYKTHEVQAIIIFVEKAAYHNEN